MTVDLQRLYFSLCEVNDLVVDVRRGTSCCPRCGNDLRGLKLALDEK